MHSKDMDMGLGIRKNYCSRQGGQHTTMREKRKKRKNGTKKSYRQKGNTR